MASSLQLGINAAKAGHMKEALDFLKDAIIEEPQNADVWVWIAAIIDDPQKQEIFLDKALEIDPGNVPAQRGLAYLQKRKRHEASVQNDQLSDHTQPISPFPASKVPKQKEKDLGWSKETEQDLGVASLPPDSASEASSTPEEGLKKLPKLSTFEYTLLGVVVVVFCFIGLLAASSIFGFDLPLDFLWGNQPKLSTEPPYPGVFLYENEIFFDIQQHEGIPASDIGIPTSFEKEPVVALWETDADANLLKLVYQNGEYIRFDQFEGRGGAVLVQPHSTLEPGLYCLQQQSQNPNQAALYWCFKVTEPPLID